MILGIALLSTATASAAGLRDEGQIRNYDADFTDCGTTASNVCLATHVHARTQKDQAGSAELNTSTLDVLLLQITFHPDGSLDITPIAEGTTNAKIKTNAFKSASFAGAVPLSDGTTANVNLAFTGTGPTLDETSTTTYPAPMCPTGTATGTLRLQTRTADATGTVVAHGNAEAVTNAVHNPTMFLGQAEGTCS